MAASDAGWFYAPPGVAPVGPYDEAGMKALVVGGYVVAGTCVWREGEAAWTPISEVEQLKRLLEHALPVTAVAAVTAEASGAARVQAAGEGAAQPSGLDPDDPMAAFEAEIAAVEAETVAEAGASEEGEPDTPEELEFEDDDGTWYVWDPKLRKYVDRDMAAGMADGAGMASGGRINEADMVYEADEEVIPMSLAEAKAAAEADAMQIAADEAGALGGVGKSRMGKKRPAENAAGAPVGEPAADGTDAGDSTDAAHEADAAELLEAAGGPGRQLKKPKKERKLPGQGNKEPEQPATWFDLKTNTSVYVTGLPDDVTVAEICEVFSKYGVIKEDEQAQPRVKIYRDKATGMAKGDALVTYLKEPSVALAVQLLDGSLFRYNMGTNMTVSAAKFEMKGEAYQAKAKTATNKRNKKKQLEKLEKRLEWGGFDDKQPPEKVTVIIKRMFEPSDFAADLMLSEELEADVRSECEKFGAVDKMKVFKHNPEGVVSIKFKESEPANKCRAAMHGRWFGGQQLEATMYDGCTNYMVYAPKESEAEQQARLDAFAAELEARAASAGAAAAAAGAAAGEPAVAAGEQQAGAAKAAAGEQAE